MKYISKFGERGEVETPDPIRAKGVAKERSNFDLAMKKYAGSLRRKFLASG
jgi:hypothetical protein